MLYFFYIKSSFTKNQKRKYISLDYDLIMKLLQHNTLPSLHAVQC